MTGNRTPPRWSSATSTWSRSATSRTPSNSTVSPEIHSDVLALPCSARPNPITSPTIGWLSGGPCRHGVATTSMSIVLPVTVALQHRRLPRGEPDRRPAQSSRAGDRRDDDRHVGEQGSPRLVEVVGVVVVGEQHGVERAEVVDRQRRAGDLVRGGSPAELVPPARRVERRVRQDPPAVELDQDGRSADVGQSQPGRHQEAPVVTSPSSRFVAVDDRLAVEVAGHRVRAHRVAADLAERPVEGEIGDRLPALLGRQQVGVPLVLA